MALRPLEIPRAGIHQAGTMQTLQGIAVSPGIAIGEALIINNEGFKIPRRFVTNDVVDVELLRLGQAIAAVATDIEKNRDTVCAQLGAQYGAIFSAHLQLLQDHKLREEIETLVRDRHYSPEYSVSRTLRRYAKLFQEMGNPTLAERASDLFDIEKSLLGKLLGCRQEELGHLTSPAIVLTHDLTPSETAGLDRHMVIGFATEIGGPGGHTAIVAKGLEIPAIVGTGLFLADVSGGDTVIVDGDLGRVIIDPDEETILRYRRQVESHRTLAVHLETLRDLPSETSDGQRIMLHANIEFPYEASVCLERGADGVGLYRTEFLYLNSVAEPSEEDHFHAYAEVARVMGSRPVVVRTLDLGADKMGHLPLGDEEKNPFLGLRSIRLSLRNLSLFRVQLRAILRASSLGKLQIMFPLISTLAELRQAKMLLADAMEDLDEHGVPFDRKIPTGIMIEVPAAVVMIESFLREVDFVSIGTNDLIQYTLAVDRSNKEVADLYNATDPAVLRLIDMTLRAARSASVPASLCGQMSGNSMYTMLLLGLGLRSLSVPPSAIPEIKKICRSVTVAQCEVIAKRALSMDNAREIDNFLREELKKVTPEFVAE